MNNIKIDKALYLKLHVIEIKFNLNHYINISLGFCDDSTFQIFLGIFKLRYINQNQEFPIDTEV